MINSSSDNVKKLNSINRRMFITGTLKFFIIKQTRWVKWQYILNQRRALLCAPKQN